MHKGRLLVWRHGRIQKFESCKHDKHTETADRIDLEAAYELSY